MTWLLSWYGAGLTSRLLHSMAVIAALPRLRWRVEANRHSGRRKQTVTSRTQQLSTHLRTAEQIQCLVNGQQKWYHRKSFGPNLSWGGLQNTLVLIMQSSVTHGLISSHWAINYTKAAATHFRGAVQMTDGVSMQPQVQSFHLSSGLLFLPLMMSNYLQLHLTCTSDGGSGCLPGVMKKKTANQHRTGSVDTNLPRQVNSPSRWCINTSLNCFPFYTTAKCVCDRVMMKYTHN